MIWQVLNIAKTSKIRVILNGAVFEQGEKIANSRETKKIGRFLGPENH